MEIFRNEGVEGIRLYKQNVELQILEQLFDEHYLVDPQFDKYYKDVYSFKDDINTKQHNNVGICIQLDRIELLDEIIGYLSNVPFEYDLYITVTNKNNKHRVRDKLNELTKLKSSRISIVATQGRDVLPLLGTFAKSIRRNDYICHIHTHNSLQADKENINWRNHLLFNLLGSDKNINRVFKIFEEHPEVGLIYPEPYQDMPYWKYTWLSNAGIADTLFNRLGLHADFSHYVDFPAGFMFWAKVKAIEPLLKLGSLFYEDISEDAEKTDGTLVQAMERSLVPLVKSLGMTFSEINFKRNTYRINRGTKNLWQYWDKSSEKLRNAIDNYEVVSFDIFDTLITRPVLVPDTAFEIAGIKINKELNFNLDYVKYRKQAEFCIRIKNDFTGDCSIDDIYVEFRKATGLSETQCEAIKQIEIQNEIDLCIPRNEMVDIFNYAKSKGKRTVLISDIYLRKQDIEAILVRCGVCGYDEIILSSMIKKRKDTGELWDYYKNYIDNAISLHIGDNEYSDIQLPLEKGLNSYHVMSGRNIFYNTMFGDKFYEKFNDKILSGDSAAIGTIISKEFNDPFALHAARGQYVINDLRTMGYVIFGPIFITFITWLIRNIKNDNRDVVLFLAREGYFLEKLYNKYLECSRQNDVSVNKVDSTYFLASRRAVSVASIIKENDILDLIEAPYKGTVSNLLSSRFGITSDNNDMVSLPEDYDKVKDILGPYKGEILKNATIERENYLRYCQELDLLRYNNIGIVDLGYSGSMQYYFSKIINKPTIGYYFMTKSNRLRGIRYEDNLMKDCFQLSDKDTNRINTIYAFILIFESLLTSPDGQFIKFSHENDALKPIFGEPGYSQKVFDSISLIYEGILDFIEDIVKTHDSYLLDLTFTQRITQIILEYIMLNNNFITDEIKNIFTVEDKYCSDGEISIFNYYRNFYNMR